jgi:hypothetical protein
MVYFGKIFCAKQVDGYTWYTAIGLYEIGFPRRATEREINDGLRLLRKESRFFIPELPSTEAIAREARSRMLTKFFVVAYGTIDGSTFNLPHFDPLKHRPFSGAITRRLDITEAAKKEREYDLMGSKPFEHVIVEMR